MEKYGPKRCECMVVALKIIQVDEAGMSAEFSQRSQPVMLQTQGFKK